MGFNHGKNKWCWKVFDKHGRLYDSGCEEKQGEARTLIKHHIEDMREEGLN